MSERRAFTALTAASPRPDTPRGSNVFDGTIMGERGHSLHVFGPGGALGLSAIGEPLAVLGITRRWTSFVPLSSGSFDTAHASRTVDRTLLHVWFDDHAGVEVQFYASGVLLGELLLPGTTDVMSASERALVGTLEEIGVLTKGQAAALCAHMTSPDEVRRRWTMGHGFERLLKFPWFDPIPLDVTEETVRVRCPGAITVAAVG